MTAKRIAIAAVVGIISAAALVAEMRGPAKTTTATDDQKVEKKIDDTSVTHAVTDTESATVQTQQAQQTQDVARDSDLQRKVVRQKTTVKKPDGTVTTVESSTTTFDKQDRLEVHEQAEQVATAKSETIQHSDVKAQTEHKETDKSETKTVTTVKTGGSGGSFSLSFFLVQDLRSTFKGKLSVTPGADIALNLWGPTSLGAAVDLTGDVALIGTYSNFSIYVHQDVIDLVHGNFHPVPGLSYDRRIIGPVGVTVGVDTSLNGYFGITVGAF